MPNAEIPVVMRKAKNDRIGEAVTGTKPLVTSLSVTNQTIRRENGQVPTSAETISIV